MPFGDYYRLIYMKGMAGEGRSSPCAGRVWRSARSRPLTTWLAGTSSAAPAPRTRPPPNAEAFRRWRIVPRMLRDVDQPRSRGHGPRPASSSRRSCSRRSAFRASSTPTASSPPPVGRGPSASASSPRRSPTTRSRTSPRRTATRRTGSSSTGRTTLRLPQSMVERAEAAGYGAIVVTVDNAFPGWKPRDLEQAYLPGGHGKGMANYVADPVFRARHEGSRGPGRGDRPLHLGLPERRPHLGRPRHPPGDDEASRSC